MNYCSHCASPVRQVIPPEDDRLRFVCPACGRIHYENPKIVVGCIPEWEGKLLLCRRDIEPARHKWTLPAGYLENSETVMAGARRETREETGAEVGKLIPYLLFDIVHVNQVYIMFRSQLTRPHFHKTRESCDVGLFREDDIPWDAIAFPVIKETLNRYFSDRPHGIFPFQTGQIRQRMTTG